MGPDRYRVVQVGLRHDGSGQSRRKATRVAVSSPPCWTGHIPGTAARRRHRRAGPQEPSSRAGFGSRTRPLGFHRLDRSGFPRWVAPHVRWLRDYDASRTLLGGCSRVTSRSSAASPSTTLGSGLPRVPWRLSFGRSNFKTPRRPYYRPMNLRSTSTTLPGASSARKCPQSSNSRTSTSRSADLHRSSSFPRNAMSFRPHRTSAGLFAKAARSCQIERSQSLAPTI